ncbi:MAG: CoA transferase [candidate division GAL15 bacterium]
MKPLALDLTRLLPGPLAGKILLELGFRVLRILPPQGDPLARLHPEAHAWLNAGKESETVDLKLEAGKARLKALVREAAVLLETNRPGVMERLGLGPKVLRKINPRLVYVRLAGFRDPARHAAPGHDLTYLAAAGLLPRVGEAWRPVQLADVTGAMWAALATLEGLRRGGGVCEVYLTEAAQVFAYPPLPFLDGSVLCYAIYPARDGQVALAALEAHLWARFCQAAGKEAWAGAAYTPAREENPLYRQACAFFREKSAREWEAWAAEHGLPLAAVRPYTPRGFGLPWAFAEEAQVEK